MYSNKRLFFHRIVSSMFCGALLLSACNSDEEDIVPTNPGDNPVTQDPDSDDPETATAVVADFSFETDSDVSPVTATITNSTTGATTYAWTFEGGEPATSDQKDPGAVVFTQAGELKVTLKASNGAQIDSVSQTIVVERSGEIVTFENVKLGGVDQHDSIGCFFSTKTGKVYKEGEVTEKNGSSIDITYVAIEGGLRFFSTPTDVSGWDLPEIPGAVDTEFINYLESSDINITAEEFDAMEDEMLIKDIVIENDQNAFPNETPRIILFQNHAGQKGLIKVKEISGRRDGYIVFDIKMQKHSN